MIVLSWAAYIHIYIYMCVEREIDSKRDTERERDRERGREIVCCRTSCVCIYIYIYVHIYVHIAGSATHMTNMQQKQVCVAIRLYAMEPEAKSCCKCDAIFLDLRSFCNTIHDFVW